MFSIIREVLKTGIKLLTELFSGELPGYLYTCCIGLALYILIYSYWENRAQFTAGSYLKNLLIETASHLIAWIVAMLIAKFFAGIIDQGVAPMEDRTYYTAGMLMLITYDLSVVLSLITRKLNIKRDAGEISSFLFGLGLAYVIFLLAGEYWFAELTMSQPYLITLSIATAIFAALFKISQREEFG
ncbi:DUF5823 family protein [Paenibacillus sp. FSL L8-0436]|uniref:DUF5823 family protein n=1 Tax=Paenibacillus sp. FSL L8-0436 TaxID=2954686 RepID=UPI003158D8D5